MSRTRLLGLLTAAAFIAIAVIVLTTRSGGGPAQADAPHPGLDFSIGADVNADGVDDCDTSGGPAECQADSGSFQLTVRLRELGGLSNYKGIRMVMDPVGVYFKRSPTVLWPDCDHTPSGFGEQPYLAFGCENLGSGTSSFVGPVGQVTMHCTDPEASVELVHGVDVYGTRVTDEAHQAHAEQGSETLTISCGATPTPFPTRTPTPTSTPCASTGCPPLNFAIGIDLNGDGTNDCGTGVPSVVGDGAPDAVPVEVTSTACSAAADAKLDVRVYLMDRGGIAYAGAGSHVYYSGLTSYGRGTTVWTCHTFDVAGSDATFEYAASIIRFAPPCAVPQANVGLMNKFSFTCTQGGEISLGHAPGETEISDGDGYSHTEAGPDILTINCGARSAALPGDSDCNGSVNSIDAALILQNTAGLLANIPCADGADANSDGTINAIDAALVLQVSAGLLDEL